MRGVTRNSYYSAHPPRPAQSQPLGAGHLPDPADGGDPWGRPVTGQAGALFPYPRRCRARCSRGPRHLCRDPRVPWALLILQLRPTAASPGPDTGPHGRSEKDVTPPPIPSEVLPGAPRHVRAPVWAPAGRAPGHVGETCVLGRREELGEEGPYPADTFLQLLFKKPSRPFPFLAALAFTWEADAQ